MTAFDRAGRHQPTERMDHIADTTWDTRREHRFDTAVAAAPGISAGAMVALLLGILLFAMLALWAIAVTGDTGLGSAVTSLLRGQSPHFCQINTC